MVKELCEICQHSGNDYRYNFRTLVCLLDKKAPKYRFFCDKVSLIMDEKLKLQKDFQSKIRKQNSIWQRLGGTKINFLEKQYNYNINPEFKLELKNNKLYHLFGLISIILIISFAIYYLIKSDFVWFKSDYFYIIFFISVILIRVGYNFLDELLNNKTQLLIDSNGINDVTNRFIPWELMFNVFIEKEGGGEELPENFIHIWSLFGDYKISLNRLKINLNEIENLIGYYKNSGKFNKLRISELK